MAPIPCFVAMLAACGSATAPPQPRTSPPTSTPSPSAPRPIPVGTSLPTPPPATDATDHAAFERVESGWRPLAQLCDGIGGGPVVLLTTPDAQGRAMLTTLSRPTLAPGAQPVRVGAQDAGAGSVWRDLTDDSGRTIGAVRSINPGMLGDAAATTLPTLSSVRLGDREMRCRWLPRGRLLLVMAKRTAIVTAEDGGYTYRSFDHDQPGHVTAGGEAGTSSTPTAQVSGGQLVASTGRRESYTFSAPPWTYRVTASADPRAPGATVTVLRDGRAVSSAPALAYVMAARRGG